MPNKNYQKGYRLERNIVNLARDNNLIAYRSAGSHSLIDCTIIDPISRKIYFIQAKAKKLSQNARNRLKTHNYNTSQLLNDEFLAEFHIITKLEELKHILKLKGGKEIKWQRE